MISLCGVALIGDSRFRDRLKTVLASANGVELTDEMEPSEAARNVSSLKADVVLVQAGAISRALPRVIRQLRALDPQPKVVVFSSHSAETDVYRALRNGADGYALESEDPADIVDAIKDVMADHIYVSNAVFQKGKRSRR